MHLPNLSYLLGHSGVISEVGQGFVMVGDPLSFSNLVRRIVHSPSPIKHRIQEIALVYIPISVNKGAITVEEIIVKIASISAIASHEHTISIFHSLAPSSVICDLVSLIQDTIAIHQPVGEIAYVFAPICPFVGPRPLFHSIVELSHIFTSIPIHLSSMTIGNTIYKIALVSHSLIHIGEGSMPVELGLLELTLIN